MSTRWRQTGSLIPTTTSPLLRTTANFYGFGWVGCPGHLRSFYKPASLMAQMASLTDPSIHALQLVGFYARAREIRQLPSQVNEYGVVWYSDYGGGVEGGPLWAGGPLPRTPDSEEGPIWSTPRRTYHTNLPFEETEEIKANLTRRVMELRTSPLRGRDLDEVLIHWMGRNFPGFASWGPALRDKMTLAIRGRNKEQKQQGLLDIRKWFEQSFWDQGLYRWRHRYEVDWAV